MDPKLAEIYGTNQMDENDLEKLAAAELAEGLANDDQLDTDGLTEEDLEAVAQDVLNAGAEEGEQEGGNIDGQEKTSAAEAQEKLAEADYLGRVMAHSYVNELRSIEKTAGTDFTGAISAPVAKAAPGRGARALEAAKQVGGRAAFGLGALGEKASLGKLTGGKAMGLGGALAAGGLAAGAYGAKKMMGKGKSKKSSAEPEYSAVDTLVLQRAQEILDASGIDPDGLEKQSFALTDEGHKLDAKRYGELAKAHHGMGEAEEEYAKDAPMKAMMLRGMTGPAHRLANRHADYAAKRHEKGENAYNPFGGIMTKSRQESKEKKSADEGIDPREVLANEVEQRAWNLLNDYGVVPSEE